MIRIEDAQPDRWTEALALLEKFWPRSAADWAEHFPVGCVMRVAVVDGSVVGVLTGRPREGLVQQLCVDATARGRGFGRALLDDFERLTSLAGRPFVILRARAVSREPDPVEFYERCGFQRFGAPGENRFRREIRKL